jgi:hypothetical protein
MIGSSAVAGAVLGLLASQLALLALLLLAVWLLHEVRAGPPP